VEVVEFCCAEAAVLYFVKAFGGAEVVAVLCAEFVCSHWFELAGEGLTT
jgi:hypothetical protein